MNVRSTVSSLERNVHSHGYRAAMYDVVIRGANTFVIWKNLQCIVIVDPDPRCTVVAPRFRYVKLDKQTLLSHADKPAYGQYEQGCGIGKLLDRARSVLPIRSGCTSPPPFATRIGSGKQIVLSS